MDSKVEIFIKKLRLLAEEQVYFNLKAEINNIVLNIIAYVE